MAIKHASFSKDKDGIIIFVAENASEASVLALTIAHYKKTLKILERARKDPRILDSIATQIVNTNTLGATLFVRRKNARK